MNHTKPNEFFLSKKEIRNIIRNQCFVLGFIVFQCMYWLGYLMVTRPEVGQIDPVSLTPIFPNILKPYIVIVLIFDVSYCFFVYNRYFSKRNVHNNCVYLSDFFLVFFAGLFPFFYAMMSL